MNLDYNLIKILSNPNTILPSFCKILQEDLLGSLSDSVSFLQAPSRTYKNLLVSWQFLLKSYNISFFFVFISKERTDSSCVKRMQGPANMYTGIDMGSFKHDGT